MSYKIAKKSEKLPLLSEEVKLEARSFNEVSNVTEHRVFLYCGAAPFRPHVVFPNLVHLQ